jgi:hypothetical protein
VAGEDAPDAGQDDDRRHRALDLIRDRTCAIQEEVERITRGLDRPNAPEPLQGPPHAASSEAAQEPVHLDAQVPLAGLEGARARFLGQTPQPAPHRHPPSRRRAMPPAA